MTAKEVTLYLNVEIKTIRNWTSENKISYVKLGSTVRYPKTKIDHWLKSKEKKSFEEKYLSKFIYIFVSAL